MRFRLDTQEAGAFLELYRPIGNDPYTRDLRRDLLSMEDQADWDRAMAACEYCRLTDVPNERVSLDEILAVASGVVVEIDGKRYCFENGGSENKPLIYAHESGARLVFNDRHKLTPDILKYITENGFKRVEL